MDFHSFGDRFYGQRYLSVQNFMGFCRSVGVHVTKEAELEFYEEHRLLLPAARIINPDDYLHLIKGGHDIPDRYLALDRLLAQIHFPSFIERQPEQSLAHPIDEAFGTLPELVDPRQTQFHPWDSHIEVFYHYWQVYELYQIRRDKGMYADTAFVLRHEDEWHFTPGHTTESTLLWKWPDAEGDRLGLHDDFDALSRFIYLYNQERRRTFAPVEPNEDLIKSLAPDDYERYKSRVMNIAKDTSQQYGLDAECLYAFLRKLMEMHHTYQAAEKSKLADSIKTDIGLLMRMIAWITGQDFTYIAEKAGNLRRYPGPNYLETVFPNARAGAHDSAVKMLTLWAKDHYNPYVTTLFAVDDTNLDALASYIEKTDLAVFEYALLILNETWWDTSDSIQPATMYFCIKNLAALPEAFLREIYEHRLASGAVQSVSKHDLYQCACSLFARETNLSSLWRVIQSGYNSGYTAAKDQAEFIQKFEHLRAQMDLSGISNEDYLGYCFLMAVLVRNFTHHHQIEESSHTFDNRYLRSIRSILSVVFFVWVYAHRQGWIP
jgi:hypothetical protein